MKTIILFLFLSLNLFAQSSLLTLFDSGVEIEPEVSLYLTVATSLSDSQATNVNDFVVMLKDSLGISLLSEKFDIIYLLANEDSVSSKFNLVKRDFDGVMVGTGVFTQWQGWIPNGASGYINTTYIPSSDNTTYTLNSGSFGLYSRTDAVTGQIDAGVVGTSGSTYIALKYDAGAGYSSSNGGAITSGALASSAGLMSISRTASDLIRTYKNGTQFGADATAAATGLPNKEMCVLAYNNNGSVVNNTIREIAFFFMGAGLTAVEIRKLNNCIEVYMDNLGTGVE